MTSWKSQYIDNCIIVYSFLCIHGMRILDYVLSFEGLIMY